MEALPWWTYAYEPSFYVLKEESADGLTADYFQVDGLGYKCPTGFAANAVPGWANGDEGDGTYNNTGNKTCAHALEACLDAEYDLDWTKFTDYGFEAARVSPEYDELDYLLMDIDWWDLDEIAEELYADKTIYWVDFDGASVNTWRWMEGDVFYNWDEDKLFMCLDPLATTLGDGLAADPNVKANFGTDAFLLVW